MGRISGTSNYKKMIHSYDKGKYKGLTIKEFVAIFNISERTFFDRLHRGLSVKEALSKGRVVLKVEKVEKKPKRNKKIKPIKSVESVEVETPVEFITEDKPIKTKRKVYCGSKYQSYIDAYDGGKYCHYSMPKFSQALNISQRTLYQCLKDGEDFNKAVDRLSRGELKHKSKPRKSIVDKCNEFIEQVKSNIDTELPVEVKSNTLETQSVVVEESIKEVLDKVELKIDNIDLTPIETEKPIIVNKFTPSSDYMALIDAYDDGRYKGLTLKQFCDELNINYSTLRHKYRKTKDFNASVISLLKPSITEQSVDEANEILNNIKANIVVLPETIESVEKVETIETSKSVETETPIEVEPVKEESNIEVKADKPVKWHIQAINEYEDGKYKGYNVRDFCKALGFNEKKFYTLIKTCSSLDEVLHYDENKAQLLEKEKIKPSVTSSSKLSESFLSKGITASNRKTIPLYNLPGHDRKPLCNPNEIDFTKEEQQRYLDEVYEYGPNHCYRNYDMKSFCDMMGLHYDYFLYNFKKGKSIREIIAKA